MKRYERQVVKAIGMRSEEEAIKALSMHPLVEESRAPLLFATVMDAHTRGGTPAILV
jgi:hypothetical protein